MAKKKHLLEVLREREHRAAGGGEPSKRPPTAVRQPMDLPPMLFPFLGSALILALLVWAGVSFFGVGTDSADSLESNTDSAVVFAGDSVLAVTYAGSLRDKAVEAALALVALGYNAKLAPSKAPSGEDQFKLFVVPADLSELESLLQEIRTLPLLGQAAPFAGASLDTLPS
jgi:hypothetical protein